MVLRIPVAQKLGLKTDDGLATIDQLDIEGGLSLRHVQCIVETPYQIEGMNAIGASGVDLDGLLGYGILARFRMQIDLSKDRMLWTPVNNIPDSLKTRKHPATTDDSEAKLEVTGALLKFLGPLVKPLDRPSQHRGFIGITLSESIGVVTISRVLEKSAADSAGIQVNDSLVSIDDQPVHSIEQAQANAAKTLAHQPVTLVVSRNGAQLKMKIISGDGL